MKSMTSPPTTDREYAYFRATGTDNVSEISKKLGLEPDEAWNVGDNFERRGHQFKRRTGSWEIGSGLDDQLDLDAHIDALLWKLTKHQPALLEIGTRFKTQIVCVSYNWQSFSWELTLEHQKSAASLGISFLIDAYSYGDHHEEMVELREQLNVRPDLETD